MTPAFRPPPGRLKPLVHAARNEDLDIALRHPERFNDEVRELHRQAHGLADCTITAEAYTWCQAQPAGGLTGCADCGRIIFVPPGELERDDDDDPAEITVDHATGTAWIRAPGETRARTLQGLPKPGA